MEVIKYPSKADWPSLVKRPALMLPFYSILHPDCIE